MQSLHIDQVEENFKIWRKQKKHTSEAIPNELIEQIRAISGKYSSGVLIQRLNLSSSKLKGILGLSQQKAKVKKSSNNSKNFIPINTVNNPYPQIELNLPNGLIIKVRS